MKPLFWHRSEVGTDTPGPREGHTLTYASSLEGFILYGGTGPQHYRDAAVFSTLSKRWSALPTADKGPAERSGHVAWMDEARQILYVHGGKSAKREALADLYALPLEVKAWVRVTFAEEQPEERTSHAVAVIRDRAFVFGGASPVTPYMKDLWSFHYGALVWNGQRVNGQGWTRHAVRGQGPAARKGHTMVSFDEKLYIFGGFTERGLANDLHAISTVDWKCYKVNAKGALPQPRAYHSSIVVNGGFMVMVGGMEYAIDGKVERRRALDDFYTLNLRDMRWSLQTLPPGGSIPTRRYAHALAYGSTSATLQMVLLGGCDRSYCPMDVYWLEETKLAPGQAWQVQEAESREKASAMQTESAIALQRQKLQDMQQVLDSSQQRISSLEAQKARFAALLDKGKRSTKDESRRQAKQIDFLERANKFRLERIQVLQEQDRLYCEKTDIVLQRTDELEDIVKKAESLLITLDHSYNELISSSTL